MAAFHRATGADLYQLRGDMHWNARGLRAFFDALTPALSDLVANLGECGIPESAAP
jgi:hypothetical protein